MHIFLEKENKNKTIQFNGTVATLLSQLHINPEMVLVTRDNTLITESDTVCNTDNLKILSVISGG
tara:strand:- start:1 stop:195 length:195 start_codon:yes stop_codon:yes gene_type:complete